MKCTVSNGSRGNQLFLTSLMQTTSGCGTTLFLSLRKTIWIKSLCSFSLPPSPVCCRSFVRPRQLFLRRGDKPVVIRSLRNNPPMKEQKPISTAPYFPNGVFVLLTVAPPGHLKQVRVPSLPIKSRFNVGRAAKTVENITLSPHLSSFLLLHSSIVFSLSDAGIL